MSTVYNKVTVNGDTLMDITDTTAVAADVASGKYFYAASGVKTAGTGSSIFAPIGTKVFENVPEYTDTSAWEASHDTGIDIKNTDYAWGIVIITCDSAITTSSEWGMTVAFWGRYTSNGNVYASGMMQKGSSSLSKEAMVTNALGTGSYGVNVPSNTSNITFSRKCHGTGCPKCRAGNYTVKVYGMTAF